MRAALAILVLALPAAAAAGEVEQNNCILEAARQLPKASHLTVESVLAQEVSPTRYKIELRTKIGDRVMPFRFLCETVNTVASVRGLFDNPL